MAAAASAALAALRYTSKQLVRIIDRALTSSRGPVCCDRGPAQLHGSQLNRETRGRREFDKGHESKRSQKQNPIHHVARIRLRRMRLLCVLAGLLSAAVLGEPVNKDAAAADKLSLALSDVSGSSDKLEKAAAVVEDTPSKDEKAKRSPIAATAVYGASPQHHGQYVIRHGDDAPEVSHNKYTIIQYVSDSYVIVFMASAAAAAAVVEARRVREQDVEAAVAAFISCQNRSQLCKSSCDDDDYDERPCASFFLVKSSNTRQACICSQHQARTYIIAIHACNRLLFRKIERKMLRVNVESNCQQACIHTRACDPKSRPNELGEPKMQSNCRVGPEYLALLQQYLVEQPEPQHQIAGRQQHQRTHLHQQPERHYQNQPIQRVRIGALLEQELVKLIEKQPVQHKQRIDVDFEITLLCEYLSARIACMSDPIMHRIIVKFEIALCSKCLLAFIARKHDPIMHRVNVVF
ncbi:unnamed protein product [Trichogramma brassicae]|uniref:Uncharacterized protein n=1 Tax=Trichogramma brassicae TaxID=86971 RepID=A0A6H5IXX6_9HYME|nr:unnamed protein product [Trichogramma brassicae]